MKEIKAVQDYYPDHFGQCYGCGRLNEVGLQLKTVWNGDETLTLFVPRSYHTAIPGFVYGGLLASLIDCHGTGSAALALARDQNIELTEYNAPRCVTASLKVDYLKPTPINSELRIVGKIKELKGRKVIIEASLFSGETECVKGEIIAIQVPDNFGE
ncbi:MAG: PaaI family thioesterase [Bacteroidales bacterium]|nr:PaaI family thioesterase [Bacteroidales bacterium]